MKKLLVFVTIFFFSLIFSQPAEAFKTAGGSAMLKNEFLGIKEADPRQEKLAGFLEKHRSPLTSYAQNFIQAADDYQLDWRLLPAIAGVESTFGKCIPANSYNAYGWSNGAHRFQSWEESIDHVSEYLKKNYLDRGLDTPYKMGPVYAPPSKTWPGKVVYFMNQIENFGQKTPAGISGLTL